MLRRYHPVMILDHCFSNELCETFKAGAFSGPGLTGMYKDLDFASIVKNIRFFGAINCFMCGNRHNPKTKTIVFILHWDFKSC